MQRKTRKHLGLSLSALAGFGAIWGVAQPLPYVIVGPGPAYNVISDLEGAVMIKVSGVPLEDNPGTLDMLTVSVWGTPKNPPTAGDILAAYLSSDKIVEPMDLYYPFNENLDEVIKAERKDFSDSVDAAIAVAKGRLDPVVAKNLKVEVNLDDVGGPSAGR